MRLIAVWLRPVAWAIERVDQCVAAPGWLSNVRTITCSICASESLRGWPGRGSSSRPSTPASPKRCHHFLTVCRQIFSSDAIAAGLAPVEARKTIRERTAKACAVFRRRDQPSSVSRSSAVTANTGKLRPRPMALLLP
jgi:hypothetical protein